MKINENADAIALAMREIFETTENNMIARVNKSLIKGDKTMLAQLLESDKKKTLGLIDEVVERAGELTKTDLNKISKNSKRGTELLIKSAEKYHDKASKNIIRLSRTIPLKEAIFKQTQIGINEGLKITYKNGRQMGYKEYMEMNVRTTVQQEISASQLSAGGQAGVVFYITNHFADCADDHKAFQGKMYYDSRWKTFGYEKSDIQKIIDSKNMKSVQSVRDGKPYLTTRPNCRHTFTAISLEQAGGSNKAVIDKLKLSSGSYRDKNYDDSQKLRYNERQIRFYKNRMEQNKLLGDIVPPGVIAHDRVLISKWQKAQRSLTDSNPALSRDYRRETQKVLLYNLGVAKK